MHRPERSVPFQKLFKRGRLEHFGHLESGAAELVRFLLFGHFEFDQFGREGTVGTDLGGQVGDFFIESINIPKRRTFKNIFL